MSVGLRGGAFRCPKRDRKKVRAGFAKALVGPTFTSRTRAKSFGDSARLRAALRAVTTSEIRDNLRPTSD